MRNSNKRKIQFVMGTLFLISGIALLILSVTTPWGSYKSVDAFQCSKMCEPRGVLSWSREACVCQEVK